MEGEARRPYSQSRHSLSPKRKGCLDSQRNPPEDARPPRCARSGHGYGMSYNSWMAVHASLSNDQLVAYCNPLSMLSSLDRPDREISMCQCGQGCEKRREETRLRHLATTSPVHAASHACWFVGEVAAADGSHFLPLKLGSLWAMLPDFQPMFKLGASRPPRANGMCAQFLLPCPLKVDILFDNGQDHWGSFSPPANPSHCHHALHLLRCISSPSCKSLICSRDDTSVT